MTKRITAGLALLAALATVGPVEAQSRRSDPLIGQIRPEWISAPIRFLSDALLRGRETGQPGAELAAKYVAAEFEAAGLKPVGNFSDYLMPVALRHSSVVTDGTSAELTGPAGPIPFALDQDFVVHPSKNESEASFSGEIVFVGWGVTAPEQGYDDYAGIDVRGKVVAMVFGGPASVPPDERGHYASLGIKQRNALAHGAVGVITVMPAPIKLLTKSLGQLEGFGWTDSAGVAHSPFFETGAVVRLSDSGTVKLFTAAGRTFPSVLERLTKGPASFATGVRIAFRGRFAQRALTAPNAIGMIEGSDPVLKREYVVYSAHLDHVGVGEPVDGDSVYHGAIDNGGGTASLIALARAHAGLTRPKRSVIFLAVTGEEKGILGSDFFVHHPPVPIASIVANVNLDNAVLTRPIKDLVAYGAKYSSLGRVAESAFARLGIGASADPLPSMTIFTRSDHYTFMMGGVPALMLFPGAASDLPNQQQWFGRVHHTPRDRFDQGIDWNAAVTYVTANLIVGYEVANTPARPRWLGRYFFQ